MAPAGIAEAITTSNAANRQRIVGKPTRPTRLGPARGTHTRYVGVAFLASALSGDVGDVEGEAGI